MPDTLPPTPPAPEPAPQRQPPGYFNQAQLEDLDTAEDVLRELRKEPFTSLVAAKRDLLPEWQQAYADLLAEARAKTTLTGQGKGKKKAAKLNADGTERVLLTALQGIQSAAKQKHRMMAEDDDPATNFPLDGYLINARLNPNRASLLQNAESLLAKALADALPGHKTAADLLPIRNALLAYTNAEGGQSETDKLTEEERIARDKLVKRINSRRLAAQNAIDGLFPYTDEDNGPTRKAFGLPDNRPFNG